MKKILLLLCTVLCLPAFVPPPKAPLGSLAGLPAELKQHISQRLIQYGDALNIDALAKDILNLSHTNKTLRTQINNLQNMRIILNSLPRSAAIYLIEKLALMPVIQNNMLAILQTLPKSGAKYLAAVLKNTPGMQRDEVKEWLKGITLEGGQELYTAITTPGPDLNVNAVAKMLANPNINVNWQSSPYGFTPLTSASFYGSTEIVRLLLDAGVAAQLADNSGNNALMRSSQFGNLPIVKQLLAVGAHVNAQDANGQSSLMYASLNGLVEVVKALLAADAQVNARDKQDFTALMQASVEGHPEVVRLLLAAGADINAKATYRGNTHTPLSLARKNIDFIIANQPERVNDYRATIKLLENAEMTTNWRCAIQ